jgi:ferredoxin
MSTLPILVGCGSREADGSANDKHVKIVSAELIELLRRDEEAFRTKCASVSATETKRLGYFLQLLDAIKGDKPKKLRRFSMLIAFDLSDIDPDEVASDPVGFLQEEISRRAANASPVLWRARFSDELGAGILCPSIVDALYVLVLIHIGSGTAGKTGKCVSCGKIFVRSRGFRRGTCSDACRKRASRRIAKLNK